jgi:hypothetical protein
MRMTSWISISSSEVCIAKTFSFVTVPGHCWKSWRSGKCWIEVRPADDKVFVSVSKKPTHSKFQWNHSRYG